MVLLTVRTHGRNKRENVIYHAHAHGQSYRDCYLPCACARSKLRRFLFTVRTPTVQVNAITYRAWSNVPIKNY